MHFTALSYVQLPYLKQRVKITTVHTVNYIYEDKKPTMRISIKSLSVVTKLKDQKTLFFCT